jgi:hypothetical protein
MKNLSLAFIILFMFIIPADTRPAVECMFMGYIKQVIEPNYFTIEDLYTRKTEKLIIAGTQCSTSKSFNFSHKHQLLKRYIDQPNQLLTFLSYGKDKYGRIVGDIKAFSLVGQLSYDLVANGICFWYRPFNPSDSMMAKLEHYAREHHEGVWKK